MRFSTLMRQARSRLEVIVTFIAILELAKQQRVSVMQERLFGEIYIALRQPPANVAPTANPSPSET
ncbi:MAG: segregation/condensation protein A, partial [Chloroflexi bacterium]|nr:segregation/condensation protein A [Chloroflexota bacterium]